MKGSTRFQLVRKRDPSLTGERQPGLGPLGLLSSEREPAGSLASSILRTRVDEVMTRAAPSVSVELSVETAAWLLLDRGLDGAPVVDLHERLVGYVSASDLLRERCDSGQTEENVPLRARANGSRPMDPGFSSTEIARSTVGEIMSPITLAVRASSPLIVAAALMGFEEAQALPVTRNGRLVGVVTALDILRWLSRKAGYTGAAREQLARLAEPAAPVMTSSIATPAAE
jgi:CBS-domain-containing membrane protein